MTGPEHYREAEQAIEASTWQRQQWAENPGDTDQDQAAVIAFQWEMARAQVHATLALAAATIGPIMAGWQGDAGGWFETIAGDPR